VPLVLPHPKSFASTAGLKEGTAPPIIRAQPRGASSGREGTSPRGSFSNRPGHDTCVRVLYISLSSSWQTPRRTTPGQTGQRTWRPGPDATASPFGPFTTPPGCRPSARKSARSARCGPKVRRALKLVPGHRTGVGGPGRNDRHKYPRGDAPERTALRRGLREPANCRRFLPQQITVQAAQASSSASARKCGCVTRWWD